MQILWSTKHTIACPLRDSSIWWTEMVCWATGGPQKYTGKSMADSHAHLKITSKEWEAFLDDLQQTLDHFAVPSQAQSELKAIVNSTRSDIVTDPELGAGTSSTAASNPSWASSNR